VSAVFFLKMPVVHPVVSGVETESIRYEPQCPLFDGYAMEPESAMGPVIGPLWPLSDLDAVIGPSPLIGPHAIGPGVIGLSVIGPSALILGKAGTEHIASSSPPTPATHYAPATFAYARPLAPLVGRYHPLARSPQRYRRRSHQQSDNTSA